MGGKGWNGQKGGRVLSLGRVGREIGEEGFLLIGNVLSLPSGRDSREEQSDARCWSSVLRRFSFFKVTYSFSNLGWVCCSLTGSNCCFLTCIQEAGKVVWNSHLLKNFPQFSVIHTFKDFCIVNEAEVDVFLEFSCSFYDPTDIGNLISGSSAFSKSSLYIRKFLIHILLKLSLMNSEHYLVNM